MTWRVIKYIVVWYQSGSNSKFPNTVKNNFDRFKKNKNKPFKLNIYFVRAKFTLDLKTKTCLYICFYIIIEVVIP